MCEIINFEDKKQEKLNAAWQQAKDNEICYDFDNDDLRDIIVDKLISNSAISYVANVGVDESHKLSDLDASITPNAMIEIIYNDIINLHNNNFCEDGWVTHQKNIKSFEITRLLLVPRNKETYCVLAAFKVEEHS